MSDNLDTEDLLASIDRIKNELGSFKATNYWEYWVGLAVVVIGVTSSFWSDAFWVVPSLTLGGAMFMLEACNKARLGILQYQLARAFDCILLQSEEIFIIKEQQDSVGVVLQYAGVIEEAERKIIEAKLGGNNNESDRDKSH